MIPCEHEKYPKEYVIAERLVFHSLAAFLYSDSYRGLMQGSAPRRCHNCQRYFLLENGYNICYCNRIAPGETNCTCRQVGAHKKEASPQGKNPARLEYDKAYNRLRTQKARGKISLDEWNQRVAKAQEIKDRAEHGELSDREMREELGEDIVLPGQWVQHRMRFPYFPGFSQQLP